MAAAEAKIQSVCFVDVNIIQNGQNVTFFRQATCAERTREHSSQWIDDEIRCYTLSPTPLLESQQSLALNITQSSELTFLFLSNIVSRKTI